ncbi:MAG: replication initiation protein [Candidatus Thiodiazotropha sp. (ex Lucinoma aequizonata)]|nr:replication initiation protein [Candidatus Thiodiazotropha sp. (ex Lucinoma aequizonata)]MCU7902825.1 replication initiation protein [Candidatus Thiodiazotropha sp. (ex Lucinoma aequizonata)]
MNSDFTRKRKVYKSNNLVEASYQLSLSEGRILLACIAKIDPCKTIIKDMDFKITADEYSEIFNIPIKQSYKTLHEATNRLFDRRIRMEDEGGCLIREIRWLQEKAVYHEGYGAVSLRFSDHVSKYLSMLIPPFTKYQLSKVSGLNSYYAVRLYEMLIQFKSTGLFLISLESFKIRLGLDGRYSRFTDFKRRVIIPAVKELQAKSNLKIEWTTIREKGAVNKLQFRFNEYDQVVRNFEY